MANLPTIISSVQPTISGGGQAQNERAAFMSPSRQTVGSGITAMGKGLGNAAQGFAAIRQGQKAREEAVWRAKYAAKKAEVSANLWKLSNNPSDDMLDVAAKEVEEGYSTFFEENPYPGDPDVGTAFRDRALSEGAQEVQMRIVPKYDTHMFKRAADEITNSSKAAGRAVVDTLYSATDFEEVHESITSMMQTIGESVEPLITRNNAYSVNKFLQEHAAEALDMAAYSPVITEHNMRRLIDSVENTGVDIPYEKEQTFLYRARKTHTSLVTDSIRYETNEQILKSDIARAVFERFNLADTDPMEIRDVIPALVDEFAPPVSLDDYPEYMIKDEAFQIAVQSYGDMRRKAIRTFANAYHEDGGVAAELIEWDPRIRDLAEKSAVDYQRLMAVDQEIGRTDKLLKEAQTPQGTLYDTDSLEEILYRLDSEKITLETRLDSYKRQRAAIEIEYGNLDDGLLNTRDVPDYRTLETSFNALQEENTPHAARLFLNRAWDVAGQNAMHYIPRMIFNDERTATKNMTLWFGSINPAIPDPVLRKIHSGSTYVVNKQALMAKGIDDLEDYKETIMESLSEYNEDHPVFQYFHQNARKFNYNHSVASNAFSELFANMYLEIAEQRELELSEDGFFDPSIADEVSSILQSAVIFHNVKSESGHKFAYAVGTKSPNGEPLAGGDSSLLRWATFRNTGFTGTNEVQDALEFNFFRQLRMTHEPGSVVGRMSDYINSAIMKLNKVVPVATRIDQGEYSAVLGLYERMSPENIQFDFQGRDDINQIASLVYTNNPDIVFSKEEIEAALSDAESEHYKSVMPYVFNTLVKHSQFVADIQNGEQVMVWSVANGRFNPQSEGVITGEGFDDVGYQPIRDKNGKPFTVPLKQYLEFQVTWNDAWFAWWREAASDIMSTRGNKDAVIRDIDIPTEEFPNVFGGGFLF